MTSFQAEPLKTLTCMNGIIELYSDRIIIRKTGLFSHFLLAFPGNSRTISLYHLIGIKFFPGIVLMNGVIQLITPNGSILLFFAHGSYLQALEMKDTIEDLLSRQRVFPELKKKLGGT